MNRISAEIVCLRIWFAEHMLRDGRMLPRLSRAKIKNNIVHPRDSNNRGIIMEKPSAMETATKKAYSLDDLAEMMGVSKKTIAKWRINGEIGYSQIGAVILFSEKDIDDFLNTHHFEPYAANNSR